jgi:hypothetical protein
MIARHPGTTRATQAQGASAWVALIAAVAIGGAGSVVGGAGALVLTVPLVVGVASSSILSREEGEASFLIPFAWLVAAPALAAPLQSELVKLIARQSCTGIAGTGDPTWQCSSAALLPTLLVALLGAAAVLWLLSPDGRVREAALIAGVLGVARAVAPALIWVAQGDITVRGSSMFPGVLVESPALVVGPLLWFVSLMIAAVFGWGVLRLSWLKVLAAGFGVLLVALYFLWPSAFS